jgi:hypothetical protein
MEGGRPPHPRYGVAVCPLAEDASTESQQLDGPPVGGILVLFVSERWSEDIGREAGSFVESSATDTLSALAAGITIPALSLRAI